MRILSIVPNLNIGGAQRLALDLAQRFAEAGDESIICAAGSSGGLRNQVKSLRMFHFERRISLVSIVAYVVFLRRCVKTSRPDIVLVHLLPLNLLVLALSGLRIIRIPVVAVEHNHLSAAEDSSSVTAIRRRILSLLIRSLYARASHVVGVSQQVADDISSRMRRNTNAVSIPNGVDAVVVMQRAAERTVESEKMALLTSPKLVAVGRLVHAKAFDDLLAAFAELRSREEYAFASLTILGEGPERKNLLRLSEQLGVANEVWLPGSVTNPWAVMKKADIFVLSSRNEGLPLVVAEAVACGLPIVATNCRSGPAEILAGNPHSRLVPVGDVHAIADAIADLLSRDSRIPAVRLRPELTIEVASRKYRALLVDTLTQSTSRSQRRGQRHVALP